MFLTLIKLLQEAQKKKTPHHNGCNNSQLAQTPDLLSFETQYIKFKSSSANTGSDC